LCEGGSLCFATTAGGDTYNCYPSDQAEGESCGEQYGDCDGLFLACTGDGTSTATGVCKPHVLAGAACNVSGDGICFQGTSCIPASVDSNDWKCVKNGYIGDTCGFGAIGWCNAPLGCKFTNETSGTCEVDPCAGLYDDSTCDQEGCLYGDPACG